MVADPVSGRPDSDRAVSNVRHTPLAPYDGTDQQVIDTLWGSDAVFCARCVPGMWHHRDYHKATPSSADLSVPSFDNQSEARVGHGIDCVVIQITGPGAGGIVLHSVDAHELGCLLIEQARHARAVRRANTITTGTEATSNG